MSKPSRRPAREVQKARIKAHKKLRQQQRAEGLEPPRRTSLPNRKSALQTVDEERETRQDAVVEHFKILHAQLPALLLRLSHIPDPRNPKKIRHKLTMVLVYGLLSFVFQMASRREANRTMTRPTFHANLKLLVPELEEIPHHDTLYRLLKRLEVDQLESAHLDLIERLIRKKKFRRYLIKGWYPIAIDGTQKWVRDWCFSDQALERTVGSGDKTQSYIYVVEACLALRNGMVLPLMSEFLEISADEFDRDPQDCEQRGFQRLVERLKKRFPRLRILLLLDGLYPNGPTIDLCRRYRWQFMIVLQDKSLPSVWEEFEGLLLLEPQNRHRSTWGDRRQHFEWVNDIEYTYDDPQDHRKHRELRIHVVVCNETWHSVDRSGEIVNHRSRHVWISSEPLTRDNLHLRCNLAARHRWGIEANILVEKHHGYHYEHCFAYDWNAMKGYHYLMRLAHLFNVLARYCQRLQAAVQTLGVRGLLDVLRETLAGPWLQPEQVRDRLSRLFQIRLVW